MRTTLTFREVQALQEVACQAGHLKRCFYVQVAADGTRTVRFKAPHGHIADVLAALRQELGEVDRE